MNFNFFEWMRDGVKRAVLLGVSDAVNTMGMPPEEESSRDKILSFLQDDTQNAAGRRRVTGSTPNPTGSSSGQRKLGRSISDIHPAKEAS